MHLRMEFDSGVDAFGNYSVSFTFITSSWDPWFDVAFVVSFVVSLVAVDKVAAVIQSSLCYPFVWVCPFGFPQIFFPDCFLFHLVVRLHCFIYATAISYFLISLSYFISCSLLNLLMKFPQYSTLQRSWWWSTWLSLLIKRT